MASSDRLPEAALTTDAVRASDQVVGGAPRISSACPVLGARCDDRRERDPQVLAQLALLDATQDRTLEQALVGSFTDY